LLDVFRIKPQPAATRKGCRYPLCSAGGESAVIDIQAKQSLRNIERDHVPRSHPRERATRRSFGRSVQYYCSISRTAHAGVGDTDHVGHALAENFWRQQHVPDLCHARVAAGTAIFEHHDATLIDVQRLVVNPGVIFFNRLEHHCPTAMLQQARTRG
jgi:hypothetical protein